METNTMKTESITSLVSQMSPKVSIFFLMLDVKSVSCYLWFCVLSRSSPLGHLYDGDEREEDIMGGGWQHGSC